MADTVMGASTHALLLEALVGSVSLRLQYRVSGHRCELWWWYRRSISMACLTSRTTESYSYLAWLLRAGRIRAAT